ncbi:MAG: homocysteine S-methyltransferase family protein [Clostridia bacterium]|nr:homocysteine S-methyltransferase family protein [Clostridia bacterium]
MKITEYMKNHLLYLDGGMGTLLQAEGLCGGELPEHWNLTHGETITRIHRSYYDAGSNVVCTNTFGANRLKFSSEELETIVAAAIRHAQQAARTSESAQPKWVALDVGPTGRMLKPYGDLDFEDAVSIFAETVRLGARYGADLIFIETMNDSYETKAALLAAREHCTLPVFVSNAYGADGKLMTGASPEAMVAMLEGMGADAIGMNCSLGPKLLGDVARRYLQCASVPVLLKPNAGLPKLIDGKTVYDLSPEEFAHDCADLITEGIRIAGGCCGTTPDFIRALTAKTAHAVPLPITPKYQTCVSSYTHAVKLGEHPVLIGELINPTGKKRFKEALRAGDMDYILNEGLAQQEKGVHLLDVNVGLPEIDEKTVLTQAVCELQAILDLPLQIDTADPVAMEAALRRYNGKAMLNSVNGKQESMEAVFPLARRYGGVVVALTLDENGIPETAEERLAIAKRILARAEEYGIHKKDLLFDPLAMAVSADARAASETLRAVELIRRELGCCVSLGVSNVSFGLPARDLLNSTFFAMALDRGLSAAIMNPYSQDMMKTYYAYRSLMGLDENCKDYVAFARDLPCPTPTATPAAKPAVKTEETGALMHAIVKGLKEEAGRLAAEALQTTEPMRLVQEQIIPALDRVGVGFEEQTIFLPGLLMSAEAAKAAFEAVKTYIQDQSDSAPEATCAVVLATVKGDIHDIGKNIVKLMLENYGFAVTDLGRDVAPEDVVACTVRLHAPIVGLSALMTTTVPAMEETIRLLRREAPWCKVMVGGAVLNEEYARAIGADCYAKDAMEAVRCAEELKKALEQPTS